jgi:putative membrane protein
MSHLEAVLATTNDDRWDHMNGWGGGWMWLWGIAMMALLVLLIVWLIRSTTGGPAQTPPSSDPKNRAREILAERYARGEVTTEEYRERVEQLR